MSSFTLLNSSSAYSTFLCGENLFLLNFARVTFNIKHGGCAGLLIRLIHRPALRAVIKNRVKEWVP